MEARITTLLRYRFDTVQQLQQHMHVIDGRMLFFYREPRIVLGGGARVLLEISYSTSEQQTVLRGTQLGRVEGAIAGYWLEFPDAKLLKAAAAGFSLRKHKRLGCDLMVEVRKGRKPQLGRLIDVSMGGARLASVQGLRQGEVVQLRLVLPEADWPSELGSLDVLRADAGQGDAALRFVRSDPVARVASSKLFQAMMKSWKNATEVSHPPVCCQGGQVMEPPTPHIKARG